MSTKLPREECNVFQQEIKVPKPNKESKPQIVGTSGEGNIPNIIKNNFSVIAQILLTADNRDQIANAFTRVSDHNVIINVQWLFYVLEHLMGKDQNAYECMDKSQIPNKMHLGNNTCIQHFIDHSYVFI